MIDPGNKIRRARYYAKHKDRHKESLKTCDVAKKRVRDAIWAKEHPEVMKASRKKFYEANRGRLMAGNRRRQKIKDLAKNLSPGHLFEMEGMYLFCRIFKGFEVDHIFPMKGKLISGLHTPENLQILPSAANRSKRNNWSDENGNL